MNYYTPEKHRRAAGIGKISRYAWGGDYHKILRKKLKTFWKWLEKEFPGVQGRYYVDTGPVMEKVWAQKAGLGWIGKHTNLITQDFGSWVFLSEVITTLEPECDPPATDHCGTCTLCIEACPTQAIVAPYVLDANLCISYLTIEHEGELEGPVTDHLDQWVFGCDVCQDVCPWNRKFSILSGEEKFAPRPWNETPDLATWADMTEQEFEEKFSGSPVKRAQHSGLQRNIRAILRGSASASKDGLKPGTTIPASYEIEKQ
jgi:epoxyqueuosine reductase